MGTRSFLGEVFLAAVTLVLGIVLRDSTPVQIVLFGIAGLALTALIVHAVVSSDWFWRRVARQVELHLASEPAPASHTIIEEAPSVGWVPRGSKPSDEQLAKAIDDLLDELSTIRGRLTDAIEKRYYGFKFFLPSAKYTQHRDVISARSAEAREALSQVYVIADNLNEKLPGGSSDGIAMEHVPSPNAEALRGLVDEAQLKLRELRP